MPVRLLLLILLIVTLLPAQSRTLEVWPGATPVLDGVLSAGEWEDATRFTGVRNWTHTFTLKRVAVSRYANDYARNMDSR